MNAPAERWRSETDSSLTTPKSPFQSIAYRITHGGCQVTPVLDDFLAQRICPGTGIAWNRRESDPNITAVATWAGQPSSVTPVICVKWPFFRFTEVKARKALAAIRRHLGSF